MCGKQPDVAVLQDLLIYALKGLSLQQILICGIWPCRLAGVTHIADKDFTPVIEKALEMPGFTEDTEGKSVMVDFARNAALSVADNVIEAVKGKALSHFFLVAGCDGVNRKP